MPKHPKAVIFSLGIPEHGWLPVEFLCSELNLNFAASDVLNDTAGELCTVLMRLKSAGSGEVTWWLEPFTYVFSFERAGKLYALRVSEADDFDAPVVNLQLCAEPMTKCCSLLELLYWDFIPKPTRKRIGGIKQTT